MQNIRNTHNQGVSVVEIVVGVSIAALILVFVTHAIMRFMNTGRDISEKTQALYIAEEGLELVRIMRDDAWANISGLSDGTTYYLEVGAGSVTTTTTQEVIEGYARSFEIDSVERNGSDDIVASGADDPNSKYVTVTVTWDTPVKTVELTSILADIRNP